MKPPNSISENAMLELDPGKRITAKSALTSRYFLSEPRAPDDPADLGKIDLGDADDGSGNFHEFQTKKRRREAKVVAQKASENAKQLGMDDKDAYDAAYKEHMRKSAMEGGGGQEGSRGCRKEGGRAEGTEAQRGGGGSRKGQGEGG